VVTDLAVVLVTTTQDHSAHSGESDLAVNPPRPQDPREDERRLLEVFDRVDRPVFGGRDFAAAAPDGTSVSGVLYASASALGHSNECVFGGHYAVE
jgi:hypothetical protein